MGTDKKKKDGRIKNGGFRHGAGRPEGSGIECKNKTVRVPVDVLEAAKDQGVNLTGIMVEGARKKLKLKDPKAKKSAKK